METSIVIPVHNERQSLPRLYRQLNQLSKGGAHFGEFLFVNDGSTDGSEKFLQAIAQNDSRIRLLQSRKHIGKGAALRSGFFESRGDFILCLDSDLQCNPQDLLRVRRELDHCDAVLGYRINRRQADGWGKSFTSRCANHFRNLLLGESIQDAGCPIRGFRRRCLAVCDRLDDLDVFLFSLIQAKGYRIKQIPVTIFPRAFGKSHYNVRNRAFHLWHMLWIVRKIKRQFMQKNQTTP